MNYSSDVSPLMDKLLAASKLEGMTIENLSTAFKMGVPPASIRLLIQAMEDAHSRKMKIHQEFQAFRQRK